MKTYQHASLLLNAFAAVTVTAQEPACRTGATPLADAFVLANPLYALVLGQELEIYVPANREHFGANGDAVRCARALARAFLGSSIQLYDPTDVQRRQELNTQLESMGISPGQPEATPAGAMYGAAMQLSRLARVLPAAADGDFGPLQTPANDLEQSQLQLGSVLRLLFAQDPEMLDVIRPLIQNAAALEHQALVRAAQQLAHAR